MELKRIIISEVHDQQVIMLKEVEGDRNFPIVIGIFEATSIDRRVKGMPSPRPLTHDLVASIIDNLGGELRDIYISELKDHTYFAKLRIRQNGEMVEVDRQAIGQPHLRNPHCHASPITSPRRHGVPPCRTRRPIASIRPQSSRPKRSWPTTSPSVLMWSSKDVFAWGQAACCAPTSIC